LPRDSFSSAFAFTLPATVIDSTLRFQPNRFMLRMPYLICSLILLVCLAVIKYVLKDAYDWFGDFGGMAFGLAFILLMIVIGFAIDARDKRRSQEVLPPRRPGLR
jgi:hypothetical protein